MIRLATWNMKQAVAPKKPLADLWHWVEERIRPDIVVLTEAKVPKNGLPEGWNAILTPGGMGPTRPWGTIIAGRGVELRRVSEVRVGGSTSRLQARWPAALQVADVYVGRKRWATVVGLYAVTRDKNDKPCFNGSYSAPLLLDVVRPLLESDRGNRVIVAGDFNLWPIYMPNRKLANLRLTDLLEFSGQARPPLERCANCAGRPGCHHVWTHKNPRGPNAAVQQIDFIFGTGTIRRDLVRVYGGVGDFEDAWDVSDHAPLVAEFR